MSTDGWYFEILWLENYKSIKLKSFVIYKIIYI